MLSNNEIREKIDNNNRIIESMLRPNFFTLNNIVADLLKENESLQHQCNHQYEEGFCIWCYKQEGY